MKKKIGIVFVLLMIGIPMLSILMDHGMITVTHEVIQSSKIPKAFEGYKILQLSDLHSRDFGLNNILLLQKIQKEKPDIIVMTGDMVNQSDDDFSVFLQLASNIATEYPTYYIVGNHEQNMKAAKKESLMASLQERNITILDNEKVTLEKGGESIDLYGLWYSLRYYKDGNHEYTKEITLKANNLKTVLGEPIGNRYGILLTHNPLYFSAYADWGADLVLSGHIHGGVVRIPFLGGVLSPEKTLFPPYDAGKYKMESTDMVVNRGLGYGAIPFRIFNMPEISVITLQHKIS